MRETEENEMAKKQVRVVEASEKLVGLIDQGHEADVELKNWTFKDKGLKKMIGDELEGVFEGDETSIRANGTKASVLFTRSEKFTIGGTADDEEEIRRLADNGLLGSAVSVDTVLNVPVADRVKAAQILKAAGIEATVSTKLSVTAGEYRALIQSRTASTEAKAARDKLVGLVEDEVSFRVKYEKA